MSLQCESGSLGISATPVLNNVVAWVSLDPRLGTLVFYPRDAAEKLEKMYEAPASGLAAEPVNLGVSFGGAIVSLNDAGELPVAIQRTSRGRRDVHRFEIHGSDVEPWTVTTHGILTERGWRLVRSTEPGAEALSVDVPLDATLKLCSGAKQARPDSQSALSMASATGGSSSAASAAVATVDEGVALWEWCMHATHSANDLPDDAWGVYGLELNEEIETAYQSAAKTVDINVGVRQYQIVFGDAFGLPGTARQVDQLYKKKRHVRRRIVSIAQRDTRLRHIGEGNTEATNADVEDKEATCAICFQEFADTRAMPSIKLRECGHKFHAACCQNLIDAAKPCPYCRCNVNWKIAGLNE